MLLIGIAYWLAGGRTLTYENFDVSDFLDQNLAWLLSPRSLVTIIAYVLVAALLAFARIGRDIYAAGGHRKAAIQSGARVGPVLLTCFVFSGGFAALAGALMSLSLATASATMNGANVLSQAVAAAIIGGVALEGGVGTPFGVAGSVLIPHNPQQWPKPHERQFGSNPAHQRMSAASHCPARRPDRCPLRESYPRPNGG